MLFNRMGRKKIEFGSNSPYLKDSSDQEKIAHYFSCVKDRKQSPKFDKQLKLPEIKHLPKFLIVFPTH